MKTFNNLLLVSLSLFIIPLGNINDVKDFSITSIVTTDPCSSSNEIGQSSIPKFSIGEQKPKSSLADGRYYEWIIEFNDGMKGRLFQGGNSLRYFIEDPSGKNYYFKDKQATIRALYIYKKYGCLSTMYTN